MRGGGDARLCTSRTDEELALAELLLISSVALGRVVGRVGDEQLRVD